MLVQNINIHQTMALTCHNAWETHTRLFFLAAETEKPQNLHTTGQSVFFF